MEEGSLSGAEEVEALFPEEIIDSKNLLILSLFWSMES
jgi:hypothetical protein